ncbi:MAG: ATP-binding protein [Acidobacteria bacterium]|nr:MAG: ATP-binding protein [Acidobacteriota bacterium]
MGERSSWRTTTHDWSEDLDEEHLVGVRERLGRGASAGGLRHLVLEVLAYADEEAESLGRKGTAAVTHHGDGSITVADDGRGTDTRTDGDGRVVRKPVMATPDVRFRDEASAPRLPDGLPRRGMSTVAALSSRLVHQNHRRDGSWSQTYRRGIPDDDLAAVEPRETTGTSVTFTASLDGPRDLVDTDLDAFPWLTVRRTRDE